jgi:2-polyprenyl-3-methyl-5-hydroxy-6-metoxy-1,4-benzoquinol methylase
MKKKKETKNVKIKRIYLKRKEKKLDKLYDWYNPDVQFSTSQYNKYFSILLNKAYGNDLSKLKILDVGCGDGNFIRTLIEWGCEPKNITGIDLMRYRINTCKKKTHSDVKFIVGNFSKQFKNFDLVVANTVFTSILKSNERKILAHNMWNATKINGWVMIFDFRYNNPYNKNVKKISIKDLKKYFNHSNKFFYCYLLMIPIIARKIVKYSYIFSEILIFIFPFLKSHFIFMAKKNKNNR